MERFNNPTSIEFSASFGRVTRKEDLVWECESLICDQNYYTEVRYRQDSEATGKPASDYGIVAQIVRAPC